MQTDAIIYRKESKMHAMNTKSTLNNMRGFTLVELMIVVFLSAIAVIAIYRGYTAFSHSADAQEQIIEMQQNLRIGMYSLFKDVMRAGMTEEDNDTLGIGTDRMSVKALTFLTAETLITDPTDPDYNIDEWILEFAMDLGSDKGGAVPEFADDGEDNDGDDDIDEADESWMGDDDINDNDERVRYKLSPVDPAVPNWFDLQREVWTCDSSGACDYGPPQTVITNVCALDFTYVQADDSVLNPLQRPLIETERALVETVEITMVVRTTNEDYRITNKETYNNLRGTEVLGPQNDNFRRRAMSMRVKVRNANLL